MNKQPVWSLILLCWAVAACAPAAPSAALSVAPTVEAQPTTVNQPPTTAPSARLSPSPAPLPSSTLPPPPSPTSPPSASPTITPTPGPFAMSANPFAGIASAGSIGALGRGQARAVQFLPQSNAIAVASDTGVWLYDDQTLETIQSPDGDWLAEMGRDTRPLWSPDGQTLASLEQRNKKYGVTLWEAASGKKLRWLENERGGIVKCASWSPDSQRVAAGSVLNIVRVWDAASGESVAEWKTAESVYALAWSADGSLLAAGLENGDIEIWQTADGKLLRTLTEEGTRVISMAFSPDGSQFASAHTNGDLIVWDTAVWRQQLELETPVSWVSSLAWSPDGSLLAAGGADDTLALWENGSRMPVRALDGHAGGVASFSWSADGSRLVSRSGDNRIVLWDAHTGAALGSVQGHLAAVQILAWSPDGSRLASAIADSGVYLWNPATWLSDGVLWQEAAYSLTSLAWSPDGRTLAGGFTAVGGNIGPGRVFLWDAISGEEHSFKGHDYWVTCLDWSPDGSMLATGSNDYNVIVWDPAQGKALRTFSGHHGWVKAVAFSPDGRFLASSSGTLGNSSNMEIIVWDAASGQIVHFLNQSFSGSDSSLLVWSADSSTLGAYFINEPRVALFDIASGAKLPVDKQTPYFSRLEAYSPDGQWAASGSSAGIIQVRAAGGKPSVAAPALEATPTLPAAAAPPAEIGAGSVMMSTTDQRAMVFIPAGLFRMGAGANDEQADADERPQHEVQLDAFWIDQFEVTHLDYERCVADGMCNPPAATDYNGFAYEYARAIEDAPVVNVSWFDARDYCSWAGKRLPTEAEWEKAARGLEARIFPWGDDADAFQKAWHCTGCVYVVEEPTLLDDFSRPAGVGSFPEGVSPFGVFDMAGNVWEWVADWYSAETYSQPDQVNPGGPASGEIRVIRGGSWTTAARSLRTTYREARGPSTAWIDVGFRCVMPDDRSQLTQP